MATLPSPFSRHLASADRNRSHRVLGLRRRARVGVGWPKHTKNNVLSFVSVFTLLIQPRKRKCNQFSAALFVRSQTFCPMYSRTTKCTWSRNDGSVWAQTACSASPSLQLFQAALNGLFLAASRCSSCRWAPLFLAASRGQIGGHGDARRRWSSRLPPRDAPRDRGPRLRFVSRSRRLRLA